MAREPLGKVDVEIRAPYLVYKARFIGCHQFSFLEKYEMLDKADLRLKTLSAEDLAAIRDDDTDEER